MISKNDSETSNFPLVELDTTLYDLLKAEQKDGDDAELESFCGIKPNSDLSRDNPVPLNNKYIIHGAQIEDGDDLAHLQLQICSHLLLFFAGPMNVLFLAGDGETDDETLHKDVVDANAHKAFSVIQKSQRPVIHTYANVKDYLANHDGSKIRWCFAVDFAERLPYLMHPEVTYNLNSKRWLGVSETLKSANDRIIDCEINCPHHQHKTVEHKNEWYYGGKDCETCTGGIEAEIRRIHDIIQRRQIPFVLKLNQSLSAVGTNIVKNEREKSDLLHEMSEYLSTYLPRITKANTHLHTTALILSDCIDGETMALNFFVRRDGSVVFLGACNQIATGETGAQNTAIFYNDQAKYEPRYRDTLAKIGQALNEGGYYGPVGADIMEDSDGNQITIDLNVRTPLSLLLYLLRSHFHEKRGYPVAMVYECLMLNVSREDLEQKFKKEFEEARIVLLGSVRMGEKEQWAFGLVLAGEDKDYLDKLSERILKLQI